jgi:hypothetical protein
MRDRGAVAVMVPHAPLDSVMDGASQDRRPARRLLRILSALPFARDRRFSHRQKAADLLEREPVDSPRGVTWTRPIQGSFRFRCLKAPGERCQT